MMHGIEDAKLRFPRGIQDLQHMRNAAICFCDSPNAIPYLASLGNEVVIRIDHQKCGHLLVICVPRHVKHPAGMSTLSIRALMIAAPLESTI
jgi:hypothetical protein